MCIKTQTIIYGAQTILYRLLILLFQFSIVVLYLREVSRTYLLICIFLIKRLLAQMFIDYFVHELSH